MTCEQFTNLGNYENCISSCLFLMHFVETDVRPHDFKMCEIEKMKFKNLNL